MAIEIKGLPLTGFSNTRDGGKTDATGSNTNHSSSAGNTVASVKSDEVTITSDAKNLRMLEASINAESEIDHERVSQLKMEIDSGSYHIDTQRVAEKIIQLEARLSA